MKYYYYYSFVTKNQKDKQLIILCIKVTWELN